MGGVGRAFGWGKKDNEIGYKMIFDWIAFLCSLGFNI